MENNALTLIDIANEVLTAGAVAATITYDGEAAYYSYDEVGNNFNVFKDANKTQFLTSCNPTVPLVKPAKTK